MNINQYSETANVTLDTLKQAVATGTLDKLLRPEMRIPITLANGNISIK